MSACLLSIILSFINTKECRRYEDSFFQCVMNGTVESIIAYDEITSQLIGIVTAQKNSPVLSEVRDRIIWKGSL